MRRRIELLCDAAAESHTAHPVGRSAPASRARVARSAATLAIVFVALAGSQASIAAVHAEALAEVHDLAKKGRPADALRRLDALMRQHPKDAALAFEKGLMLAEQKRTSEAIAVFERLGKENPSSPEPLNNLAVLYAEQGQMDKARAALEAAVHSKPSYATAYQNLASVNTRMASRAYSRALQIDDSQGVPKLALIRNLGDLPSETGERTVVAVANRAEAPRAGASGSAPASLPAAPVVAGPRAAPPATAAVPPAAPPIQVAAPPMITGKVAQGPNLGSVQTPAGPAPAAPSRTPAGPPAKAPTAVEPMPSTASASQRQATDEAREVNAAVRAWATAWARKDVDSYLDAYVPEFRANDRSSAAWQHNRRQRILGKNRISVELSGLTVEVMPERAKASFRQDYSGDSLVVSSQKTLELVKRGGRWLIRRETTGS